MKISLIIPVYNVEKYVEKCLRSCINQDLPKDEYEIIVVNDGSPDGSLEIVQRIAAQEPNIKVISQENQGLSMARNNGFAQAQGDYVWFIDSDDWIEENCLKEIADKCEAEQLDLLQIQYKLAYEDGRDCVTPNQKTLPGVLSGVEVTERGGVPDPAPFSVLRSRYLKDNNFSFYPGIYHEDSELKHRLVYLAEKIAFLGKPVYFYLQRASGSITAVPNPKRAFDYIFVAERLYDFKKHCVKEKDAIAHFDYYISMYINNALSIISRTSKEDCVEFNEYIYKKKYLFASLAVSLLKYRIEFFLFATFPKLYVGIYKILKRI